LLKMAFSFAKNPTFYTGRIQLTQSDPTVLSTALLVFIFPQVSKQEVLQKT